MNSVSYIAAELAELEQLHFDRLAADFRWTDELRSCITGAVQFAAVDRRHVEKTDMLPVVCTVGINYTQGGETMADGLFRYREGASEPSVMHSMASRDAVAFALAAYNRNTSAWRNPPYFVPRSPVGAYGSIGATGRAGLISGDPLELNDSFILVMTNLCPFITFLPWQKQAKKTLATCRVLLEGWSSSIYLDSLVRRLGESVDLWIGHSAIGGTEWVWPEFSNFRKRNNIQEWLLTPNINPQARLYLDGKFRKSSNALFPLFGPEKSV